MRCAIITAILALGLAGCNLNGLTFDTSGLSNLGLNNKVEANVSDCTKNPPQDGGVTCSLVLKNADDDQDEPEIDSGNDKIAPVVASIPTAHPIEISTKNKLFGMNVNNASWNKWSDGYVYSLARTYSIDAIIRSYTHTQNEFGTRYEAVIDEDLDVKISYTLNHENGSVYLMASGHRPDCSPSIGCAGWKLELPSGDLYFGGDDVYIKENGGTLRKEGSFYATVNYDDQTGNIAINNPNWTIDADLSAVYKSGRWNDPSEGAYWNRTNSSFNAESTGNIPTGSDIRIQGRLHGHAEVFSGTFTVQPKFMSDSELQSAECCFIIGAFGGKRSLAPLSLARDD